MTKRYAFVIDTDRCVGCRSCMISCKMENLVPDHEFRIRVLNKDNSYVNDKPAGVYPQVTESWLPVPCQHCEDAPCVKVCPTHASYVDENVIVMVDKDKCIGCHYCMWVCPYDARYADERTGTVDKCTMCSHRLEKGEQPMCVSLCSGRALHVGDVNDPESEVSQLIASKRTGFLIPEQGTKPSAYYV